VFFYNIRKSKTLELWVVKATERIIEKMS